jgi:hypothetical protein
MPDAIEWYLFELNEHLEGRVPDERRDHILREAKAHLVSKSDDLAALIGDEGEARKRAVKQYGSPKVHAQLHITEISQLGERLLLILFSGTLAFVPLSPELSLYISGRMFSFPFLLQVLIIFSAMLWQPKRTFLAPVFALLYSIGFQFVTGLTSIVAVVTLPTMLLFMQLSAGYVHQWLKRRKLAESATRVSLSL